MKHRNLSLILKIALMVFIAFTIILGNEIRIGMKRYINNTLESDASTNVSLLEKLEKIYVEGNYLLYYDQPSVLQSDDFLDTYNSFLEDPYKMRCLVDKDGKILDISRAYYEGPKIHIVTEKGDQKNIVFFNVSSLKDRDLVKIENFLLEHTSKDIQIELSFIGATEGQKEVSMFEDIQIKSIYFDDYQIFDNNKIKGNVTKYKGYLGSFEDLDYHFLYEKENLLNDNYYDGFNGEIVKEKVVINDFASMRKTFTKQIKDNFNDYVNNGKKFMTTSYADYYLLDLLDDPNHSALKYSTTMCKFVDWVSIKNETPQTSQQLEDEATEGYCFIIQKYNHLYFDAVRNFVVDNITTYSLTILLMGLICIGLAYFIIKPIRKVEQAAKAITQKDFRHHLRANRNDEIGSLARSINSMSDELEKTINTLHLEIDHVQQLEDLRKEFVSNFTHEIKTPLGIINGFSELIELEEDEHKRNEYIGIIQQETHKINQLVLAMLDLSKLESKNISLDMTEVHLSDLCDDILETMQYLIDKKNITIIKEYKDSVIQADYQKMEMVLTNLIANALRHTYENGHIFITINEIGFYIENEGNHISDEDLSKVWLAFHKTNKSRNDTGTGLGLSICKAVFDLHEMKYEVKNTSKGVLFFFEF